MEVVNPPVNGLLETKSLSSALPDSKTPEQRPKYVQILQEKTGQRPLRSPAALGASSASATPEKSAEASPSNEKVLKTEKKPTQARTRPSGPAGANGRRPMPKIYLKKQEIVTMPKDIEYREFEISPDNVVFFSGPNHYMSALYPVKVIVDGNQYNSVEHYYQGCKIFTLLGKEAAQELKSAVTPVDVKKATKELLKGKVTRQKLDEWKAKESFLVLKHAIKQKFLQNEDLQKALLDTGNKILIQTYMGDNFYAAGANAKYATNWVTRHLNQKIKIPVDIAAENFKYLPMVANGKNAYGWILMHVREEIRAL